MILNFLIRKPPTLVSAFPGVVKPTDPVSWNHITQNSVMALTFISSAFRPAGMPRSLSQIFKSSISVNVGDDDKEVPSEAIELTPQQHAKLLRKVDWHILPLFASLYLFCFLDRTNIGNAKVAGMATDLKLTGLKYNIAAAVFFISYCLGQIPSNLVLKFVQPSMWIPFIMVLWGLITTLTCLVNSFQGLIIVRIFLGLTESGLFPGVTYYVSLWYPRADRAFRIAIFSCFGILGGAGSGFLTYYIEKMNGLGGLRGWQWIFCLEGITTVLLAFAALFFLQNYPETASFLTDTEKRYLTNLLKTDSKGLATHYDIRFVLQAFRDYKVYLQCATLFCVFIPAYGMILFIPTIITELGYSAISTQLLSITPYVAGCVSSIAFAIYSDKQHIRGPYVIAGSLIALLGFLLLYTRPSAGAAYAGVVFTTLGNFPTVPVQLAWSSSNAGGDTKRNVAIAMNLAIGNLGGICASFLFFDPPRYHVGLGVILGLLSCAILLASFLMWDSNRLNKQKDIVCRELAIADEQGDEYREKGDDSPLFRYSL